MKRRIFILIAALALVSGCATTKSTYKIPDNVADLNKRLMSIGQSTSKCIPPANNLTLHIGLSHKKIVYLRDNERIVFSEGMFTYNDDTLKFFMAHEIAHNKLGHSAKRKTASAVTTGAMMAVNFIVPGSGLLNYAVNPAIVNNYSKSQELDADMEAARACIECMGVSKDAIIKAMLQMSKDTADGGDFWSTHPSWDDRIRQIEGMEK